MSLMKNISWRSLAAWKRNRDVFLRTWKTNFLPPFLEPILYLLAMGLGFGTLINDLVFRGETIEYIQFLAPGLLAISIMYGAFFECSFGSFVRMHYQKTFDAMVATPLTIEDVIAGEILWGATKSLINTTIVLAVITAFGLATFPGLLFVPLIAFLGGMMFASLAMLFTALVPNIDSFNYPFFLLITPMFLFSGTFFPLDVLPTWAQNLAYALPLTHVSIVVRDLCFNFFGLIDVAGIIYMVIFTTIVFFSLFTLFNARSDEASAFSGMFSNKWLWASIALAMLLQVAVVHAPFLQALDCTTVSLVTPVLAGAAFNFESPPCAAGTTLTGGGSNVNLTLTSGNNWLQSSPNLAGTAWTCRGINTTASNVNETCYARCCSVPGR